MWLGRIANKMPSMFLLADRDAGRLNNFDLLRFIAAVMVIYSHAYALMGIKSLEPLKALTGGWLSFGGVAVDIFFIVSGYLVTRSLFVRGNLLNYCEARVLRIFPGLAICLVICILMGAILSNLSLADYFQSSAVYSYWWKNVSLYRLQFDLPGVFEQNPYPIAVNGSLWTLPHEIRMYLLVLVLGVVSSTLRFTSAWLPPLIAAVLAGWYFLFEAPLGAEPVTGFRLASYFCIGMLFYFFRQRIRLSGELVVVGGAMAMLLFETHFFWPIFAFILAYFVFWFVYHPRIQCWKFSKRGDFSYGLYIYAFPIQQSLIMQAPTITPEQHFLSAFALTFIFAFASWSMVESPSLELKGKFYPWVLHLIGKITYKRANGDKQ